MNAGDAALLAHATHPGALAEFVRRGVQVSSPPRLHAKVLATSTTPVVGSANASANSTSLQEAIVVSTDVATRREIREFVSGLDDTTVVDENFLAAAWATWRRGRDDDGWPGADGATPVRAFLPPGSSTVVGAHLRRRAGPLNREAHLSPPNSDEHDIRA